MRIGWNKHLPIHLGLQMGQELAHIWLKRSFPRCLDKYIGIEYFENGWGGSSFKIPDLRVFWTHKYPMIRHYQTPKRIIFGQKYVGIWLPNVPLQHLLEVNWWASVRAYNWKGPSWIVWYVFIGYYNSNWRLPVSSFASPVRHSFNNMAP